MNPFQDQRKMMHKCIGFSPDELSGYMGSVAVLSQALSASWKELVVPSEDSCLKLLIDLISKSRFLARTGLS